jgi:lysophospholipase L1-like esterase
LKEYAAAEGIQYVDYYSALSNGKDGMKDEYTSDRCHPTPLGYNVMERVAVQAIKEALNTDKDYFVTPD